VTPALAALRLAGVVLLAVALSGCSHMTKEEGRALAQRIDDVKNLTAKNEVRAAQLAQQLDQQLRRLRAVVDEATKVVTRNSADVGLQVQKQQTELAQINGRLDDLQHAQDALTTQFQDYRAASDTKLEQLTNAVAAAKNPPIPDNANALYAEAKRRLQASAWQDARRLFEAFVNRYPKDKRAARAQFDIGEAYFGEKRFADAIRGGYTKVVDNFPKSDVVPDAMYKNGLAFYALKYCGDAKVYFQELLKRYPRTQWKKEANQELRRLKKNQRNKAICSP
jgi:tol-pal system protein YbgF